MGACYSKAAAAAAVDDNDSSSDSKKHKQLWKKKKKKKKRSSKEDGVASKAVGFGVNNEIPPIPGRLTVNSSSKFASLYTQQGKKGTNQDSMIVWENFGSSGDAVFCGVFDGHGPFGHVVSKKVRDSLPLVLCTEWKAVSTREDSKPTDVSGNKDPVEGGSVSMDEENYDSFEFDENENLPEMFQPLKMSFLKAFKLMDKELKLHPTIDCFCSGTTAVTFVKKGEDLVIGNLGDSRAVLGTRDKDNSLLAVQLTVDLKPDLPKEAARIQQCKGRVFALQDEPEVARVWLPNNDSPGLAMARAFGDFCLKDFGLISIPKVYYRRLTEKDEFIILATDGVWDVLSNKEAVDIVASAPGHALAARALVDCAVRAWRLKYPTSKIDDCAVVCLFLEHLSIKAGSIDKPVAENNSSEPVQIVAKPDENGEGLESQGKLDPSVVNCSDTTLTTDEIVPVPESAEDKLPSKWHSQSKRSLAECILNAEDDDWSALEGITRVNSLLSLPRLLSRDRGATSRRKWL